MNRADIMTYLGMSGVLDVNSHESGAKAMALSSREMDVLACVTKGMSNKEIARRLGISQQTVKNHVTSILRKLAVEDRTQAALYALRRGWVQLNQPEQRKSQE
jgi:DNA-binding NarL/FixJ family response regulator